eukprot:TRINITY_DN10291_c0_g1_i1.p1 TRINITY_DN10291_c0_g1~~TRINITY_DN10291_c0_g1_i1.p1  ORF type:complete len:464 (-),score=85.53 TRINITY_DN10291_c0_g1_i1:202-1593(-)
MVSISKIPIIASIALAIVILILTLSDAWNLLIALLVVFFPCLYLYLFYKPNTADFDLTLRLFVGGAVMAPLLSMAIALPLEILFLRICFPSWSMKEIQNALSDPNSMSNMGTGAGTIIYLFLTAFLCAGFAEELSKFAVVKCRCLANDNACCLVFPNQVSQPRCLFTYMFASGLGFSFVENMMYVFACSIDPDNSEKVICPTVGEKAVTAALRGVISMPLHVLAVLLTGIILVKKGHMIKNLVCDCYSARVALAILPGLLIHGLMDFVLFVVLVAVSDETLSAILSLVLCLFIIVPVFIYVYRTIKEIESNPIPPEEIPPLLSGMMPPLDAGQQVPMFYQNAQNGLPQTGNAGPSSINIDNTLQLSAINITSSTALVSVSSTLVPASSSFSSSSLSSSSSSSSTDSLSSSSTLPSSASSSSCASDSTFSLPIPSLSSTAASVAVDVNESKVTDSSPLIQGPRS